MPHCKLHYRVTQELNNTNNMGHIVMKNKVILLILDGLGYSYARKLMGNLEGWVDSGEATLWKGQSAQGHHGGTDAIMRDIPIYYFANPNNPIHGPAQDHVITQTALAPSILQRMGIAIPESMQTKPVWN